MSELSIGDIVLDRDDDQPSPAVIVNLPPVEAQKWDVTNNRTVADDNPNYDPAEEIAVVVFKTTLTTAYPKYTGKEPVRVSKLVKDSTSHYTFPRTRLKKIGSLDPIEIPISQIIPNRYHSRNFSFEENEKFIEEIAERGYPDPIPLVRQIDHKKYELISGHKRTWASAAGGLSKIYCDVTYMSDKKAAIGWAARHLDHYNPDQQHNALRKMRKDYPKLTEILD